MEKKSVTFNGKVDAKTAIAYLEEIVKNLKGGTICFQQKDDFVSLTLAPSVELEISATQKKEKGKISLEISWKQEKETKPEDLDFKISAKEPEMKAIEAGAPKKGTVKAPAKVEKKEEKPAPAKAPANKAQENGKEA